MLLNLRSRITRDLEAVAVVVDEILTVKLNSNLALFLNKSIFILFSSSGTNLLENVARVKTKNYT